MGIKKDISKELIIKESENCTTKKQLSEKLNISKVLLYKIISKYGIEKDLKIQRQHKENKIIPKDLIIEISKLCSSKKELACKLNINTLTLNKKIKKYGIQNDLCLSIKNVWNKGLNKSTDKRLEKMSKDRVGNKNPMHGKKPWNTGATKENNEIIKLVSLKLTGKKMSDRSKNNMAISAKKRLIHGMSGKKHSKETKEKLRISTIEMLKMNRFPQTRSQPHCAIFNYLKSENIKFEEEYPLWVFSCDFFLEEYNLIIEVNGDYWHSNPIFYPDGPKTKGQKINYYRDLKKMKAIKKSGHKLLILWENEIKDQSFTGKIKDAIYSS